MSNRSLSILEYDSDLWLALLLEVFDQLGQSALLNQDF